MLPENKNNFISSFLICSLLSFFFCLVSLSRHKKMINMDSESGPLCFVSGLRGKIYSELTIK